MIKTRICRRIQFLAFAGFIIAASCSPFFAQTCPTGVEGYPEVTFNGFKDRGCVDATGGTYCSLVCYYKIARPAPWSTMALIAAWYPKKTGPVTFDGSMCGKPAFHPDVYSKTKFAYVQAYDLHSFDRIDPTKTARAFLAQFENLGALCPGATGVLTGQPSDKTACAADGKKLQSLLATDLELADRIKYLEGSKQREVGFRDNLSFLNKVIAALNTSNYNGPMLDLINGLRTSQVSREMLAVPYGIDPSQDALAIARSARDITIAKIEYLADAPTFLQSFNDQKVFNGLEIARLRTAMASRQCGGNFLGTSCDLTGQWKFQESDGSQVWEFTPAGPGRYTAMQYYANNEAAKMKATAEVFGNDVVLRFFEGDVAINIAGSYRFKMLDGCNRGEGNWRLTGRKLETSFTAVRASFAAAKWIPDALYRIEYLGRSYSVVYKQDVDQGVPIDLFYFKIVDRFGTHVKQDGKELWGRFVRKPALGHPDQSSTQTWLVDWIPSGGQWVSETRSRVVFDVF